MSKFIKRNIESEKFNHEKDHVSRSNSPFSKISQKQIDERDKYNSELIYDIDAKYAEYIPANGFIMVRVFTRAYGKSLTGSIVDYNPKLVNIKTNSGIGNIAPITNPYPFSTKAIVVSASNGYGTSFRKGDVIDLTSEALVVGSETERLREDLKPRFGFIHPDTEDPANYLKPPSDPTHKEFGFLLIPTSFIKGTIKKAPEKDINKSPSEFPKTQDGNELLNK